MNFRLSLALACFAAAVALFIGPSTGAALEPDPFDHDLERARTALIQRDLSDARTRLLALIDSYPEHEGLGEARILLARVHLDSKKPQDAVDVLVEALKGADLGAWTGKARFLMSRAVMEAGDSKEASTIYRTEAERLSGGKRKTFLANRYIALGEEYSKPLKDPKDPLKAERPADFGRAFVFFKEAADVLSPDEHHSSLSPRMCEALLRQKKNIEAIRLASGMQKQSDTDGASPNPLLNARAHFFLARGYLAQNNQDNARRELLLLSRSSVESRREFEEAKLLLGYAYGLPSPRTSRDLKAGLATWSEFLQQVPGHKECETVRRLIVKSQVAARSEEAVETSSRDYLSAHGEHKNAPTVFAQIIESRVRRGNHASAREAIAEFLRTWPDDPQAPTYVKRISLLTLEQAAAEKSQERFVDAIGTLRHFLDTFPAHTKAPIAAVELGRILLETKSSKPALDVWSRARIRYRTSDGEQAALAGYLSATVLEEKMGRLADSVERYREVVKLHRKTNGGRLASRRLVEMNRNKLELTATRIFSTSEIPEVELVTQNVDEVKFKLLPLSFEDWFRDRQTLRGFENLDVTLVSPKKSWSWKVPDFEKYRRHKSTIKLDNLEAGTWLLSVEDGKRRSLVAVVVSDVRLLVKHSTRQCFVYAYDSKTNEDVAGARILVAEGGKIVTEGQTGPDGVWSTDFKEPSASRQVLAIKGGHVAPGCMEKNKKDEPFGYTDNARLTSDRSVYRPGSKVYFRGLARRVHNGRYTLPHGSDSVRVQVHDARGVLVLDQEEALDRHGVCQTAWQLSPEAARGEYVAVLLFRGRSFQTRFEVKDFQTPECRAVVRRLDDDGQGVAPGSKVPMVVDVRDIFGVPLSGVDVSWEVWATSWKFDTLPLQNDAWLYLAADTRHSDRGLGQMLVEGAGKADDKGVFKFEFDTALVTQDRLYTVFVRAVDKNLAPAVATTQVHATHDSFFGKIHSHRKACRVGELINIEVVTVGPGMEPVARTGVVRLLVQREGDKSPREISRTTLSTGADGRGKATLKATEAGELQLVFEGRGSRDDDVSFAARVHVTDDAVDRRVDVRLTASKAIWREGEQLKALLESPSDSSPVLVTFEGERVLKHLVLRPTKPTTEVSVPIEAAFAPNIILAAACVAEGKLRTCTEPLVVLRYLNVEVSSAESEYVPGSDVELTVKTTDQAGNPQSACLGVWVVDQALDAVAAQNENDIRAVFLNARRSHTVATSATARYAYKGRTSRIDADLLAESHKRAMDEAAKEAKKRMSVAARLKFGDFDKRSEEEDMDRFAANDAIGFGGGAGGSFAGRRGGKAKSRTVSGGGLATPSKQAPNSIANKFAETRGAYHFQVEAVVEDAEIKENQSLPLFMSQRVQQNQQRNMKMGSEGFLNSNFLASNRALQILEDGKNVQESRHDFRDLAFFSAQVVTNKKGVETIKFKLPDNLTVWNVRVEGATDSTHVGSGKSEIIAKKPLSVQLALPPFLTHKDSSSVGVQVVNRSGEKLNLEASLEVMTPDLVDVDRSKKAPRKSLSDGERMGWSTFVTAKAVGDALLRATAESGDAVDTDRVDRKIPIEAFGRRQIAGGNGVASDVGGVVDISVGDDVLAGTGNVLVMVYSSVADELKDAVASLSVVRRACLEESVNRFRPALSLALVLDRLHLEAPIGSDLLEEQGRNGLRRLLDSQNSDGGFGLWSRSVSGAFPTAMALETLEIAGHLAPVDMPTALKRAQARAQRFLSEPRTSKDAAAYLEYALSLGGKGDVEQFNRLMRHARELSPQGLAWLLMAANQMEREVQAADLQRQLLGQIRSSGGTNSVHGKTNDAWLSSSVEASAWTLKALLARGYSGVEVEGLARGLQAKRVGMGFGGSKATGAVVEALAAWIETREVTTANGEVTVLVNGKIIPDGVVSFGGQAAVGKRALPVPFELLKQGEANRFSVKSKGITDVRFVVRAEWVERADVMSARARGITVARSLSRHIPMSERSKRVRDGYSIINVDSRPEVTDPPEELSLFGGRYYTVTLDLETDADLEFVVVDDPIPAGVDIIETQVSGPFSHVELKRSSISFYFTSIKEGKIRVQYTVRATRPGAFHVASAVAAELYNPDVQGASSSSVVSISESTEISADLSPTQKTPDALRSRGLEAFERKQWKNVLELVEPLLAKDLRTRYRNELSRLVFLSHLRCGDESAAIRDFEERIGPFGLDKGLTRADTMLLGDAYYGADDFEQARSLFARVVADCFTEETKWSNHLTSIDRSIKALTDLWGSCVSWPDSEPVQRAMFRAAATWLSTVDPAKKDLTSLPDPLKRFNERGFGALRQAMSHHPGTSLEENAGFGMLRRFGELGLVDRVEVESARFVARHSESPLAQDAQAMLMRASFQQRHYDQARKAADALLEKQWITQRRNKRLPEESLHVDEARYTLGMIAHVDGSVLEAVDHYSKVRKKFPDAEQSWLFFNEKRLSLPDLSVVVAGEVDLELTTKNIEKVDCSLYRVDLGLVFAVKKSLSQINRVDLVGIAADKKWSHSLDTQKFIEARQKLTLGELSEGAWLLVVRGGNRTRTVLVVVSSLRVTLQRSGSGIRAYVIDSSNGKPVAGADLRFGDGKRIVATGVTDDRGILSLENLPRGLTVLAARGNAYALTSEK